MRPERHFSSRTVQRYRYFLQKRSKGIAIFLQKRSKGVASWVDKGEFYPQDKIRRLERNNLKNGPKVSLVGKSQAVQRYR